MVRNEDLPDRPSRMVTKNDEWPSEDLANVIEELATNFLKRMIPSVLEVSS